MSKTSASLSPAQIGQKVKTEYQNRPVEDILAARKSIINGGMPDLVTTDSIRCMVLGGLNLLLCQHRVSLVG